MATLGVGALLLLPVPELTTGHEPLAEGPWLDKVAHVALFFALGSVWLRALRVSVERAPAIGLTAFFALVAYGGLLELAQGAIGYRTASWGDFVADAFGVGMAFATALARRQLAAEDSR